MTDQIDLLNSRTDQGAFVRNHALAAAFNPKLSSGGESFQPVFSYRGSERQILQAVTDLIDSARQKIFIASFRIGEDEVLRALLKAVDRLHGRVYVVTAWDDRSLRRGLHQLGELDALEDIEENDNLAVRAQNKRFQNLTRAGIYIRGHRHCHAKFVVVDDEHALVGTANLETSALRGSATRPITGELGLVLRGRDRVLPLSRLFARLWHESTEEARPGAAYALRQREPTKDLPVLPTPNLNDPRSIIWTHHTDHHIAKAIRRTIHGAKRDLTLASFSLDGLTAKPEWVIEPLEGAARRGININLLVRSRMFYEHVRQVEILADMGVTIYGDSLNHAKAIIADETRGAIFSANFDLQRGLLDGVEAGLLLAEGDLAAKEVARYLQHAIKHSDMRFLRHPSQFQLDADFPARWKTRWPLRNAMAIRSDDTSWQELAKNVGKTPALYSQAGNGHHILVGGGIWHLTDDPLPRLTLLDPPNMPERTLRIMDEWTKARTNLETTRGFVATIMTRVRR